MSDFTTNKKALCCALTGDNPALAAEIVAWLNALPAPLAASGEAVAADGDDDTIIITHPH